MNTNTGLPPRMPPNDGVKQQTVAAGSSSSSSTSSASPGISTINNISNNNNNNSTNINGVGLGNHCDRNDKTLLDNNKRNSFCSDNTTTGYCTADCFTDNDGDVTIVSDTSTLHGGDSTNNTAYVNKCAELERTVESLKNKLISKEKELTELQLKQWSSDYLIDQLKSTISRLEKDNAQMKATIVNCYHKISR